MSFFRNRSLQQRLFLLLGAFLVLTFSALALESVFMRISTRLLSETSSTTSALRWLTMASINNNALSRNLWKTYAEYQKGTPVDEGQLGEISTVFSDLNDMIDKSIEEADDPLQLKFLNKAKKNIGQLKPVLDDILRSFKTAQGSRAEIREKVKDVMSFTTDFDEDLVLNLIKVSQANGAHANTARRAKAWSLSIIAAAGGLGAILIGVLIIFTLRLSGKLTEMSQRLKETSLTISGATRHLQESGVELSASAGQQVTAVATSHSTTERFAGLMRKLAEDSKEVLQHAEEAQEKAVAGRKITLEFNSAMNEFNAMRAEAQEIRDLVNAMKEHTQLIDEIVVKTKLLSFNTGIEAARLANRGTGFAVVAREMSMLAERTGSASKEIGALLSRGREKVEQISKTVDRRIQLSSDSSSRFSEAMNSVSSSIEKITPQIQTFRTEAQQRLSDVMKMSQVSQEINSAALQNLDLAKEVFHLVPRLQQEAQELIEHTHSLDKLISGTPQRGTAA